MSLKAAMQIVHSALNAVKAPHALIGGMALSAHGYPRATNDIDFLVHSDFRDASENQMKIIGYTLIHSTQEVAQWTGDVPIDFLYANRQISREMIANAEKTKKNGFIFDIPIVDPSDLIGLKIQAYSNNPKRLFQDLADIQKLIEFNKIDWERVKAYANAFNEWDRIEKLQPK